MFYLDIGRDYVRPYLRNFDQAKPEEIRALVEDMKAAAVKDFAYFHVTEQDLTFQLTADVHYANQYHELELKISSLDVTQEVLDQMVAGFHQLHKETFTFDLPWVPIQLTNIRMTACMAGSPFKVNKIQSGTADASAARITVRETYVDGAPAQLPIYDGDKLLAGNEIKGPCVIEQKTATSVIPVNNTVKVDEYGNFIVYWEGRA
jgi:N-methylhydantoinase A